MACINMVSIASTMQTQKLHSTTEKDSQPERISTYKPNIWKYDHLLSLTNQYSEAKYKIEAEKLKEEVGCMFSNTTSPVAQLQLIDGIDKLGLSAYFEVDTKETLENIILYMKTSSTSKDLYATALCFRLLREHGYHASQDMLKDLFDGKGKLPLDMKTSLELFEGSHLSIDGENLLNDIRLFSTKNLKNLSLDVDRLTSNPLAWRVRWYDVRKHIITAQNCNDTNPMLLKLAKLNFNIIQATHQKDLKDVIRWDPEEVQRLPKSIQICFGALHDTMEDISVEIQRQKGGPSVLPHLKQVWVNFCKALLVEATWYHKGHIPTLEDYLHNGWTSSSGPLLSLHVILGLTNENLHLCKNCQEIIYYTSLIIRLCNDQGTSTVELERGDVASSIICYMHQENVSEDVAREHIESIILNSWEKTNYHFNRLSTSHRKIMKHVINEARMAHVMYLSGDGFGVQDGETQDQVLINLVQSII
ncbi:alpha-farnesene synthase isoform X3 [Solanum lycopersicum]|uniref:alpha-farnesene synthase isoform X3 n=1 Tax=Solanum lycopersicum TaxID=4081 RepID=UPI000E1D340F|nr:alpha-farnesene synthase isoform X3 [Solanum lycopersicum]